MRHAACQIGAAAGVASAGVVGPAGTGRAQIVRRSDVQPEQMNFETIPSRGVGVALHEEPVSRDTGPSVVGAHPGRADGPRKYDGHRVRGRGKGETDVWALGNTREGPASTEDRTLCSFTPHPRHPRPRPQGNGASGGVAAHGGQRHVGQTRGTSEPTVTPQPDHLPLRNDPMLTCPCRPLGGRPIDSHARPFYIGCLLPARGLASGHMHCTPTDRTHLN